ncbi:MAG: ATP-binding protein [Oscillospiraceae bacterium]|nr:ATP-binding protein [Oscillospiraceae bacterium]
MAHDGKLLARAREALEQDRAANQAEQQRRTEQVYRDIPQVEQIDDRLRGHMAELVRLTISRPPDLAARLEALKEANLDLQMRRAGLLTEHGYPIEYLDEIISCPECQDTGLVNGVLCACMERRYNHELTKELSALLRNGNESFEQFDLNYYSDQPEAESGISPRQAMTIAFQACRHFAYSFPDISQNLLLRGGTGLGKTYLSACIARVVAEKGFSVCYDTAFSALEAFEKQKFSRSPEDAEAASVRVSRMLSCDLMILDDLGTEMVTAMSVSALYTLLNSRLNAGLHTVISTNCTNEELERRYTPQICSRIHGEFLELPFYGTDIRLMQKHGYSGDR